MQTLVADLYATPAQRGRAGAAGVDRQAAAVMLSAMAIREDG